MIVSKLGRLSLAAAFFAGAAFFAAPADAAPFKIIVTHLEPPLVPNSVIDMALQLGYYKKAGVDVEIVRVQQTPSAVAALRSGEVDIIANVSGELAEELAKDENIAIYRRPSLDHLYLLTQQNRPPFNNPDARLAVNYAIDREALVKNIVKAGQLVGGHIPQGTLGYDESLTFMPYDPDEARRLLAKAGVAPGTKIEVKAHPFWFAKGKEVMEYVAGALQEIGFEVDLQFLEPGAYTEARKSGSYDLALQQGQQSL